MYDSSFAIHGTVACLRPAVSHSQENVAADDCESVDEQRAAIVGVQT